MIMLNVDEGQAAENMDRAETTRLFEKYIKKLRITPAWDVQLEFVEDPSWRKTGDFKIDCDDLFNILLLWIHSVQHQDRFSVITINLEITGLWP